MRRLRGLARKVVSRFEKPLYSNGILSLSRLTPPDFLGIGAMKSGTTWLYENLRCHPDAYLPDRKELYYFSHAFYDGRLRHYFGKFEPGHDKVKGELTPGYATLPEDRIRFIRQIMPNVKLIFIARDPVYRSWSEAYMNLVVKPGKQLSDINDDEFIRYLTTGDCPRRSDYVNILDTWSSVFPSSQLFLGTLDEIEQSPDQLLTRLFRFLGLSIEVDLSCFPANSVVRPRYEANRMVYGGKISDGTVSSHSLMPERVKILLRETYAPQIEELTRSYDLRTEGWR